MTIGGLLFIIGAALQAGAVHLAMLIVGRVMLGFGVGLANQVGTPPAPRPLTLLFMQACVPLPYEKHQIALIPVAY